LPDAALDKTVDTLTSYKKLLNKFEVHDIVLKATSAVREAKNVSQFQAFVQKKTGFQVEVLTGLEEAQYVYLASLSAIEFHNRTFLLVDIGGGSTEIVIANENEMLFSESLPLGTVRLAEIFLSQMEPEQTYNPETVRIMEAFCEKKIAPLSAAFTKYQPEAILAFGGTPNNLAEVAVRHNLGYEKEGCLGFAYEGSLNLLHTFQNSSPEKIAKIKGLDPKRADIIMGGTLIIKSLSEHAGKLEVLTSPKGLREGIMMEYLFSRVNPNIYQQKQDNFRLNSIIDLGEKFNIRFPHAEQVDRISRQLFEQLRDLHGLSDSSLKLLQAVAYLHDIGMAINYKDHHKHSNYIISQSELAGFTQEEKEVVGLTARFHRKSSPKNNHDAFKGVSKERRQEVIQLAAILRIADALDQSYAKNVEGVDCRINEDLLEIFLQSRSEADLTLELWSVEKKKTLAEEIWQKSIMVYGQGE
jgi:exopolyphosphatase/guanosine-5'-triphosphate,3'-diphosphate pyrophosphatase